MKSRPRPGMNISTSENCSSPFGAMRRLLLHFVRLPFSLAFIKAGVKVGDKGIGLLTWLAFSLAFIKAGVKMGDKGIGLLTWLDFSLAFIKAGVKMVDKGIGLLTWLDFSLAFIKAGVKVGDKGIGLLTWLAFSFAFIRAGTVDPMVSSAAPMRRSSSPWASPPTNLPVNEGF